MDTKLLCEGKTPFVAPEGTSRQTARAMSKSYYGLKGFVTHTHGPCPYCGRKACKDRQTCRAKKNKQLASRSVMAERYEMNKD